MTEGETTLGLPKPRALSEVRELFLGQYLRPCFGDSIQGIFGFSSFSNRLTGRVVRGLADVAVETAESRPTKNQGSEVKLYMVDKKAREIFTKVGHVFADLASLRNTIILPETEEEMVRLASLVAGAVKTGESITFFTPVCPDWSRDSQGRYNFKSLGGGDSFIASKFFVNSPGILGVFEKNGVPYRGVLLFADWGLETEIDAKDTYGQKLSPEDVQMCFASTLACVDQTLRVLQKDPKLGSLFSNYQVVSMKDFLSKTIDDQQVMADMRQFFTTDRQGLRLLEVLSRAGEKINRQRLGLGEDENRAVTLQNLIEYSTVGQAVGDNSFLMVCESSTTSRSYNLPRPRDKKAPLFYIKGKGNLDKGVNIL